MNAEVTATVRRHPEAAGALLHRPAVRIFIVLTVATIVIGLTVDWLYVQRFVTTDDAFVAADVVDVSAAVPGRLDSVLVEENALVQKGQVLARMNTDPAQARLDQADAAGRAALGEVSGASAQLEMARAAVDEARSAIEGRRAETAAMSGELARLTDLQRAAPEAVSTQQLDNARAAALGAKSQLAAAQAQLRTALAQLEGQRARNRTAGAQADNAAALRRQAQLELTYADLVAPVTGHVANKLAVAGEMVQSGQQLLSIVPLKIWVVANLKETQLAHVRPGQKVDVRFDAYPDVPFHGHVDSIRWGAGQAFSLLPSENATGNFVKVVQRVPVRILLDDPVDPNHPLGPGMSAHPSIHVR